MELPKSVTQNIDKEIAKYPKGRAKSALMAALTIVQDHNKGYLTEELIQFVAAYIDVPVMAAQEVATFYSMYELKPVGRHKLCLCTNVSCQFKGSQKLVEHLKGKLGVGFGETTKDGRFTLKEVECLGACVDAPVMQVGDTYHEKLDTDKLDKLLEGMK